MQEETGSVPLPQHMSFPYEHGLRQGEHDVAMSMEGERGH